jgi:hypothetical protein
MDWMGLEKIEKKFDLFGIQTHPIPLNPHGLRVNRTSPYRGISIRYFYYVRTKLFGRPVVLGNGDQYKGLVNSAIQLVSGELVFLLSILMEIILLKYA